MIKTAKMPVLFLGHGSPMNGIEENEFVEGFRNIGQQLPRPQAILCISAHWETKGTQVTAMEAPRTIHDFGGFPEALYQVQYPAPGSPKLAAKVKELLTSTPVGLDFSWGLDHGAWTVIKQLYPNADIPVVQLSLDYEQPAEKHYAIAKELTPLRQKGILIIGSGNLVHNLRLLDWKHLDTNEYAYDWSTEALATMKQFIQDGDHTSLINYKLQGTTFNKAIPTPEHYLPLLYGLALQEPNDYISVFNDKIVGGSIAMTSFIIG